jgi:hypothetical protein
LLKAGLRPAWQGKSLAFNTAKSGDFAERITNPIELRGTKQTVIVAVTVIARHEAIRTYTGRRIASFLARRQAQTASKTGKQDNKQNGKN